MHSSTAPIALAAIILISACSDQIGGHTAPDFMHGVTSTATPWNHEDFDVADGKFAFAIFSDLNGDDLCFEPARCPPEEE